jgi:hypothetical protein
MTPKEEMLKRNRCIAFPKSLDTWWFRRQGTKWMATPNYPNCVACGSGHTKKINNEPLRKCLECGNIVGNFGYYIESIRG